MWAKKPIRERLAVPKVDFNFKDSDVIIGPIKFGVDIKDVVQQVVKARLNFTYDPEAALVTIHLNSGDVGTIAWRLIEVYRRVSGSDDSLEDMRKAAIDGMMD